MALHHVSTKKLNPPALTGFDCLLNNKTNKGTAFTKEERNQLGICGVLPPCVQPQEVQLELCRFNINRYVDSLDKYIYIMGLHDTNQRLFYRFLSEYIEDLMPIVYTPTVGLACQNYGQIVPSSPRGLFITINDKGHVKDVLRNWPEKEITVICVTDGERILGLGDLGANGMGISIGKLALYTALGGIKPHQCLPVVLDYGTNNEKFLKDPGYIGLKQRRVPENEIDEFVDEFMEAVVRCYGKHTLIQFEDWGNHNAFKYLDRYADKYCTFNDDIQGTAAVAVAGLFVSEQITGILVTDLKILFFGAGEAATGIANLVVSAGIQKGLTKETAESNVWMYDVNGLIVKGRAEPITSNQMPYAHDLQPMKDLQQVIETIKPNALIGVAGAGKAFTADIIKLMSSINTSPLIFALSNPTSKAECTALEAYTHSEGRVIFASGSPFGDVVYKKKTFRPGQGNNAFIFPGIGLGVLASGLLHVKSELFLIAAKTLADSITDADLQYGSIYPSVAKIKTLSIEIAVNIMEFAYEEGIATNLPEPKNKFAYVRALMYNTSYETSRSNIHRRQKSNSIMLKSVM